MDYVLLATDSASGKPLDSVRVRVTTITGDTSTYTTNSAEGRTQLATLASSRTLFVLSRNGYFTRDTIDTVAAKPDSVFHRPIARLLRIRMTKLGASPVDRAQLLVLARDPDLAKLKRAIVTFEDSTGDLQIVADTAGAGSVALRGLKNGKTVITVKHPGYLGHKFEITVEKADSARVPFVATLLPLGANSISGQVFYASVSGPKALRGAKVEFHLKDSLAVPDTFRTFTLTREDDYGAFKLDSVPALDGNILYFKDATSREAIKTVAITREEVLRDGPLPREILTLQSDSTQPILAEAPKDSVAPKDSLMFRFSQKVAAMDRFAVRLINQSELLVDTAWNKEHTVFRMWQKDGNWERGKKYEYELAARNEAGRNFTRPGDSLTALRGVFSVPDSVGGDSGVLVPRRIGFTMFNSGAYHVFSESDTSTSQKPDSSSQFARLRWSWDSTAGRKADSLLIYFHDEGYSVDNWQLWGAVPGFADSATLSFSDHYSTSRVANQSQPLPFKAGSKLFFRVLSKHQGKILKDTTLDVLEQGMGPTVYVALAKGSDTLMTGPNAVDSLSAAFLKVASDPASKYDWGATRPTPIVTVNGAVDTAVAKWKWVDGKNGRVNYKLPPTLTTATRIRLDLNGVLYQGKPIWHRNRKIEFLLP